MEKLRKIYASSYSAVVTILVVTGVTIASELSEPFKEWLKGITGHHWVTKSLLSLIVFIAGFFLFWAVRKSTESSRAKKALITLFVTILIGFIAILGFYIYEYFV